MKKPLIITHVNDHIIEVDGVKFSYEFFYSFKEDWDDNYTYELIKTENGTVTISKKRKEEK